MFSNSIELHFLLTPSRTAFRRKKALHGMHVGTPKLMPIDTSPHTEQRSCCFPGIVQTRSIENDCLSLGLNFV